MNKLIEAVVESAADKRNNSQKIFDFFLSNAHAGHQVPLLVREDKPAVVKVEQTVKHEHEVKEHEKIIEKVVEKPIKMPEEEKKKTPETGEEKKPSASILKNVIAPVVVGALIAGSGFVLASLAMSDKTPDLKPVNPPVQIETENSLLQHLEDRGRHIPARQ